MAGNRWHLLPESHSPLPSLPDSRGDRLGVGYVSCIPRLCSNYASSSGSKPRLYKALFNHFSLEYGTPWDWQLLVISEKEAGGLRSCAKSTRYWQGGATGRSSDSKGQGHWGGDPQVPEQGPVVGRAVGGGSGPWTGAQMETPELQGCGRKPNRAGQKSRPSEGCRGQSEIRAQQAQLSRMDKEETNRLHPPTHPRPQRCPHPQAPLHPSSPSDCKQAGHGAFAGKWACLLFPQSAASPFPRSISPGARWAGSHGSAGLRLAAWPIG